MNLLELCGIMLYYLIECDTMLRNNVIHSYYRARQLHTLVVRLELDGGSFISLIMCYVR